MHSPPSPERRAVSRARDLRHPALIVACGCIIAMISFGPRSALGNFLRPMSIDNGWNP